jgi:hypothetical protein
MQALLLHLQQQQQLTPTFCTSLQQIIIASQWLFALWSKIVQQQHQQQQLDLVPSIAHAALPLLQLTQRCSLFHIATAGTGSHGEAANEVGLPHRDLFVWQSTAGRLLLDLHQLANDRSLVDVFAAQAGAKDQVWDLLRDAAASELLLQLLAVHTAVLHQLHTAHISRHQRPRQQQQDRAQQQPSLQESKQSHASSGQQRSSSSSSSSSTCQREQQQQQQQQPSPPRLHKQLRADLLSIPAFHHDMLPILAGGQAYLNAAAAALAVKSNNGDDDLRYVGRLQLCWWTYGLQSSLYDSLEHSLAQPLPRQSALLASPAAVRLVLELQLLAAADLQQQQQRQMPVGDHADTHKQLLLEIHEDACRLLLNSSKLLQLQIRASLQASGSSCLPPEVLQRAGLQLLQALAAPVQQLQLGMFSEEMAEMAMSPTAGLSDQLFALRAAAAGLGVVNDAQAPRSKGERAVTARF